MPFVSFTPKQLEEQEGIPDGIYEVLLSGFKPKKSSDGKSINLNPQCAIVGHATLNGRRVFSNLNTNAAWLFEDFAKCFGTPGLETKGDGNLGLPGDFQGDESNPESWNYVGPLVGKVGKVECGTVPNKKEPNKPNKNQIKKFFAA